MVHYIFTHTLNKLRAVQTEPREPPRELHGALAEVARQLAAFGPALCRADAVLPRQSFNWDCGYVNVAATLRTLACSNDLDDGDEIGAIQRLVERAWRAGFDPVGADEFGGTLVGKSGKRAWIGAPESLVVFWHLRIEAFVVDVREPRGAGAAVHAVASAYFRPPSESAARAPSSRKRGAPEGADGARPPLVLHRKGHSYLLVGTLATPPAVLLRDPEDDVGTIRCVPTAMLDGRQYQIVGTGPAEPRRAEAEGRAPKRGRSAPGAAPGCRLSAIEAARRRREPNVVNAGLAASWRKGGGWLAGARWQYAPWCELRFDGDG